MEGTRRKRGAPVWKSVKRRLKGIFTGFCGSSMALRATDNMSIREEEEAAEEPLIAAMHVLNPSELCHIGPIPVGGGMNLATALAVERQLGNAGNRTDIPPLKSLVRLFEEMDDADLKTKEDVDDDRGRFGKLCCLCMRRDKGAALITCGHTYCRACSRDLWLNQGSCPLCNRSIIEILDIF